MLFSNKMNTIFNLKFFIAFQILLFTFLCKFRNVILIFAANKSKFLITIFFGVKFLYKIFAAEKMILVYETEGDFYFVKYLYQKTFYKDENVRFFTLFYLKRPFSRINNINGIHVQSLRVIKPLALRSLTPKCIIRYIFTEIFIIFCLFGHELMFAHNRDSY